MTTDFLAQITPTTNLQTKVVHLEGELDEITTEQLQQIINPLLNDQTIKTLIFDCSGLHFINSKGIGFLVEIHTHLSKDGRVLILIGASEAVMDVISLVGLTSIIPYYETVDEAIRMG